MGTQSYPRFMPWGLKRYQQTRQLHFITFGCYHRAPLLDTEQARHTFVRALERVRVWCGFYAVGYVVMPEHVHLLMSRAKMGGGDRIAVGGHGNNLDSTRPLVGPAPARNPGLRKERERPGHPRYSS
jgi:hypothetical protein